MDPLDICSYKIGFVGGGNMATAIATGLLKSGKFGKWDCLVEQIVVAFLRLKKVTIEELNRKMCPFFKLGFVQKIVGF